MYYYRAYELLIASEVELKDLLPAFAAEAVAGECLADGVIDGCAADTGTDDHDVDTVMREHTVDVRICMEEPEAIDKAYYSYRKETQELPSEAAFSLPGLARFVITDARLISVIPDITVDVDLTMISLYIIFLVLTLLLYVRGILPVHGSAVLVGEGCIILAGGSGVGKSTLCSFFRKQGFSVLSDDIAAVAFSLEGEAKVHPGFPLQKLLEDSLLAIGESPEHFEYISAENNKYKISAVDWFHASPERLLAIFELVPEQCAGVTCEEVKGMQKVLALAKNTHNLKLISLLERQKEYFEQCVQLARKIRYYRLYKPKGEFTMELQLQCIKTALQTE